MNKTWVLIKREYLSRVKTKGFIIGTLAMPLMVFVMLGIQIFMAQVGTKEKKILAVMDLSGQVAPALEEYMAKSYINSQKEPLYKFEISSGRIRQRGRPQGKIQQACAARKTECAHRAPAGYIRKQLL